MDPWGGNSLVAARYDGTGALIWSRRPRDLFTPTEYAAFDRSCAGLHWLVRRWITERHVVVLFKRPELGSGFLRLDLETGERTRGEGEDLRVLFHEGTSRDRSTALEEAVHYSGLEDLAREGWKADVTPAARVCAAALLAKGGHVEAEDFFRRAALAASGEAGQPPLVEDLRWGFERGHEACRAALHYLHLALPRAEADRILSEAVKGGGYHSMDALRAFAGQSDPTSALGYLFSAPSAWSASHLLHQIRGSEYTPDNRKNLLSGFRDVLATSPSAKERRRAAILLSGVASPDERDEVLRRGLHDPEAEVRAAAAVSLVALDGSGEPYLLELVEGLRWEDRGAASRCESALAVTGRTLKAAGRPASWVLAYAWWPELAGGICVVLFWLGVARAFPRYRARTRLGLGLTFGLVAAPPLIFALWGLYRIVSLPWAEPFVPETFGSLVVPPLVAVGLALAFACLCGSAAACLTKPLAPEAEGEGPSEAP